MCAQCSLFSTLCTDFDMHAHRLILLWPSFLCLKTLGHPAVNRSTLHSITSSVSVLLQVFQMCFNGSLSNNWRCEASQQAGEADQVTASDTSVSATHRTVEHRVGFLDASYRNNKGGSSRRGMTVFLAESRKRSSKDGMSYGSQIDYESQKIKKTVLSTTVAEQYSFMKCFGSCQFLRGLWMDHIW